MVKLVDKKKQQRATLDTMLTSMVQNGVIFAGNLRKSWKSIMPYINKKRLIYFLTERKVLLAKKAVDVIASFNKTLAKGIPPELIAA